MSVDDDLNKENRNASSWEEFRATMIIDELMRGNPEPLIKFMREDGDMSQFSPEQLDSIAKVLRGKKLKGRGRQRTRKFENRDTELFFWIAWFAEVEEFPLTDPRRSRNTAFHKAVEAIGGGITERTASNLWGECDKDYFLSAVKEN